MSDNLVFILAAVFGSILVSMTLHEAMHAFTSYWLGDDTAKYEGRLSLNPIKHIDPFLTILLPLSLILVNLSHISSRNVPIFGAAKPVPFNPGRVKWDEFGAALVGLAGPLTNLVLAVVAAGLARLMSVNTPGVLLDLLVIFIEVNIGFFVFNMIPFPPLDGSRVLYAVAPEPLQRIMHQIESYGLVGIFVFMFLLFPALQPVLTEVNISLLQFLLG